MLLLFIVAVLAGLVQGVTGFGAGIVLMLVLPSLFPLPQAAGLTGAISLGLIIMMVYRYRRYIQNSLLLVPALFFMGASALAIKLSQTIDQTALKIAFGFFLILLSLYFLSSKKGVTLTPNLLTIFLVSTISGLCDGFFGIGGPLMVLFYLSVTKTKEEYLGTIQSFFALTSVFNLSFRLLTGIFTLQMLPYGFLGLFAILIGLVIGNRIIDKINHDFVKKLTYVIIGVSGVTTLLTTIFKS